MVQKLKVGSVEKEYQNALKNLATIRRNTDRVLSADWVRCEPDSEVYVTLGDINVLLSRILRYCRPIDKNKAELVVRGQDVVGMVMHSHEPRAFFESQFPRKLESICGVINDCWEKVEAGDGYRAPHGGVRKGAGRKKGAPTTQVRIDSDLAALFKEVSEQYRKAQSERDRQRVIDMLGRI